jgi:hypothetical protein
MKKEGSRRKTSFEKKTSLVRVRPGQGSTCRVDLVLPGFYTGWSFALPDRSSHQVDPGWFRFNNYDIRSTSTRFKFFSTKKALAIPGYFFYIKKIDLRRCRGQQSSISVYI